MGNAETAIVWSGSRARAEALLAAIFPDDPEDFEASLEGDGEYVELRIIVRSENLRKARATVDDILACLSAAESGLGAIE
ncbi:MAG: KEOPS complex subunit Pcc1 [Candidatus Thermoplasmatota archaeon]|jgi:hypothetical protein|nr:KEOPS complex subunit Pcc1 [Candidatus Thermoplasmatota archaeon]MEE2625129.1 KEOPS complex subunit Pcc1 [Candidatus Thermoplasmatota archaeon]